MASMRAAFGGSSTTLRAASPRPKIDARPQPTPRSHAVRSSSAVSRSEPGSPGDSAWLDGLLAELSTARACGDARALERYIGDHPDLDREAIVRLIYEDHCARRDGGEENDG